MQVMQEKANAGAVVDIKDMMCNFTTDIIGTCAFGLEINALDNPDNMYKKIGKEIFPPTIKPSLQFKILSTFALPKLQDLYR
jgi:cytochrome P450 family 6